MLLGFLNAQHSLLLWKLEGADGDTGGSAANGTRSRRWVLVHMIEETARHLGHADIIHEQVDGTIFCVPEG